MAEYPEHEKLSEVAAESHAIGAFVEEFLASKGIMLAHYREFEDRDQPVLTTLGVPRIQELLAEFYGIGYAALMDEKDAMLAAVRREQTPVET